MTKPTILDPLLVLTLDQARQALGLAKGCLPREVRLGRLRVAKRGGRYYTTGSWLWEWLTAGEVHRQRLAAAAPTNGDEA
jgi:hypothetical protein